MTPIPDPHGQAALMLCESLAHMLIAQGTIDRDALVDTIDGVIEVKQEIAGTSESVVVSVASIILLQAVSQSLSAASHPHKPVPA